MRPKRADKKKFSNKSQYNNFSDNSLSALIHSSYNDLFKVYTKSCTHVAEEYLLGLLQCEKGHENMERMVEKVNDSNYMRYIDVTERKTKVDWAEFIKKIADDWYGDAKKITLVMDNLATHKASALYETYSPKEAKRIWDRFEFAVKLNTVFFGPPFMQVSFSNKFTALIIKAVGHFVPESRTSDDGIFVFQTYSLSQLNFFMLLKIVVKHK